MKLSNQAPQPKQAWAVAKKCGHDRRGNLKNGKTKMLSFKIYSDDLEDRFLVPFYQVKEITKHYPLTLGKVAKEITNGMDLSR